MVFLAVVGVILVMIVIGVCRVLAGVIRDVNKWDRRGSENLYYRRSKKR